MSTIVNKKGGGFQLFSKGASEIILSKCTSIVSNDGKTIPFSSDDVKNVIDTVIEPMASNGLRTIAVAYRDFPEDQGKFDYFVCLSMSLCVCLFKGDNY